jgi:6-phosphogluconate dehydrogenase
MQLGMIGLGRMGSNMVRRLARGGHDCVVFDRDAAAVEAVKGARVTPAASLEAFIDSLHSPRAVWLMVPAGAPTEETVQALCEKLEPGDALIDGGNSYYKDEVRRGGLAARRQLDYLDVGTSGGVWGLERGYCLMVGGSQAAFARLEPLFQTLAPGAGATPRTPGREGPPRPSEQGYLHCGPTGSGHFAKMIHNGIEYGLMQAYAEGFDILKNAGSDALPEEYRFELDLRELAELWRRGSVVSSWLLDLTAQALAEDPALEGYSGFVQDSGEGRWTIAAALEEAVPADVLSAALYTRFRSRQAHTFAEKILSAMRKKYGGHAEPRRG